ncbi:MAG: 4-alpha-glucanotransferase [Anaerolineae bacterium]|jgi:4-alpha-glucanotransferase
MDQNVSQANRKCGLLCHPTCVPSPFGIGDLGEGCLRLLDFVAAGGHSYWQVLPLGPTGYMDSPYQPFSAYAGNHLLIDPLALVDDGLLKLSDLAGNADLPQERVDYGAVIGYKMGLFRLALQRLAAAPALLRDELAAFAADNANWLPDYALFMALKQHHGGRRWLEWDRDIALREPEAVSRWQATLHEDIRLHTLLQFLFHRQWQAVRAHAHGLGIEIIGDVPIFVGHDSVDVWANRHLFRLDGVGRPTVVAGVPPDYFSPTGQLWGNPHYRWDLMKADGYRWWLDRLEHTLKQVDRVRIDHFRGFAAFWEVPADEETAMHGRWVLGPGKGLFEAVQARFGKPPIIAEDLGVITPDVVAIRDGFDLPGMHVLQFAFDSDATNPDLPHNYRRNCIAYTGTHDNDTSLGWYAQRDPAVQHRARMYTGTDGSAMNWTLIRLAMTSVADTAIYPLQDVLSLGSEARMNLPGRPEGNWAWRYRADDLRPELAALLHELARVTGRLPVGAEVPEAKPADRARADDVTYEPVEA